MFLQHALDFNAVNRQNSNYNKKQDILKYSTSVNMTKNFRVNLVSYYGRWGTAFQSSMIFHPHCTVTGMNIDT